MSSLWGGTLSPPVHMGWGEGTQITQGGCVLPVSPQQSLPAPHSLCHTRGQTSWLQLSLERWAGLWAGGLWSSRWALMAESPCLPRPLWTVSPSLYPARAVHAPTPTP